MGFNTTVVVMNDCLSTIKKDTRYGEKLVQAVLTAAVERPIQVDAARTAVVVATHHNSAMLPILVGRNMGYPISGAVEWDDTVETMEKELLQKLAFKHGYTLRKKPGR